MIIIGGVYEKYSLIALPWGMNTAIELGPFFYIGYLVKKYNLLSINKKLRIIGICVFLVIGTIACFTNYFTVSAVEYQYGNYLYALISGFSLSMAVILFSYFCENIELLIKIGKHIMEILIFHKVVIMIFQTKIPYFCDLLKNSNLIIELLLSTVIVFLSIVFSIIIGKIIKKFVPVLICE